MKTGPESRGDNPAGKIVVTLAQITSKYRVRQDRVTKQVRKILEGERKTGQVDVILAGDGLLRKLNLEFSRKDKTTDVLSFPMEDDLSTNSNYVGEVYISLEQAKRQARDYHATLDEEVLRLVTHGTLHLLGYDHKRTRDAKVMKRKEEEYLDARP